MNRCVSLTTSRENDSKGIPGWWWSWIAMSHELKPLAPWISFQLWGQGLQVLNQQPYLSKTMMSQLLSVIKFYCSNQPFFSLPATTEMPQWGSRYNRAASIFSAWFTWASVYPIPRGPPNLQSGPVYAPQYSALLSLVPYQLQLRGHFYTTLSSQPSPLTLACLGHFDLCTWSGQSCLHRQLPWNGHSGPPLWTATENIPPC